MTTKSEGIFNNMNNVNTKQVGYDSLIQKISNTPTRKATSGINPYFGQKQAQQSPIISQNISNSNITSSTNGYSSPTNSKVTAVKSLMINTNDDNDKFNNNGFHYQGSYSVTNNSYISQLGGLSKNSLLSNINGTLTSKNSRILDSTKSQLTLSPSRNINYRAPQSGSIKTINSLHHGLSPNNHSIYGFGNGSIGVTSPSNISQQMKTLALSRSLTFESGKLNLNNSFSPKSIGHQVPNAAFQANLNFSIDGNISRPISGNQISKQLNETNIISKISVISPTTIPNNNTMSNVTQSNSNQALIPHAHKKSVIAPIPNHEPTKCSVKRNGIVKGYAANTNQGIVRNYNEDRVSIILNIMKPASRVNEDWPKCSFFGVYDGHGGVACADFLRDNLHQFVIKESSFPWNPRESLFKGFEAAEKYFLELAGNLPNGEIDRSGSCAIVVLIVGNIHLYK